MSFKVLNIKFDISVPFAVVITFLLLMDNTGLMTASLFPVVVHELGHLIIMKKIGCAPQSIKFSAAGILISGTSYCTLKENIFVALAGPITNLFLTLLLYLLGNIFSYKILIVYSAVQLLVALINLLPIKGLDGGAISLYIFEHFNIANAKMLCSLVSIITACAVIVFGTAVFIKNTSNPSLLLLGIYLIILNIMKS